MSRVFDSVIFDLDGTLIDSAPGILQSFSIAFTQCGVTPQQSWNKSLIGPPLLQTIATQCNSHDPTLLGCIQQAFIEHYDAAGFRICTPFHGVAELLLALKSSGVRIFIATNKRHRATQQILAALEWGPYFDAIYSRDSIHPETSSKGYLLLHILAAHKLNAITTLYVGDRPEDAEAAKKAGVHFFQAAWGYDTSSSFDEHTICFSNAFDLYSRLELPPKHYPSTLLHPGND